MVRDVMIRPEVFADAEVIPTENFRDSCIDQIARALCALWLWRCVLRWRRKTSLCALLLSALIRTIATWCRWSGRQICRARL